MCKVEGGSIERRRTHDLNRFFTLNITRPGDKICLNKIFREKH